MFRYETRVEAEKCMSIMQNALLDGKQLFIDWDAGFIEGRQYRRNKRNQMQHQTQRPMMIYPSFSNVIYI